VAVAVVVVVVAAVVVMAFFEGKEINKQSKQREICTYHIAQDGV
jgi:uncharacterized protein (UPF0333 family)